MKNKTPSFLANERGKAILLIFKNIIIIATSLIAIIFALPIVFVALVLPKKLVEYLNLFLIYFTKAGTYLGKLEKEA